jgi:hypothetical protein
VNWEWRRSQKRVSVKQQVDFLIKLGLGAGAVAAILVAYAAQVVPGSGEREGITALFASGQLTRPSGVKDGHLWRMSAVWHGVA